MWEIKGRERRERDEKRTEGGERERREEDRGRRERETRRGQREESEREYGTGREEMNCKARSEEGWEATKGAFYYSQC